LGADQRRGLRRPRAGGGGRAGHGGRGVARPPVAAIDGHTFGGDGGSKSRGRRRCGLPLLAAGGGASAPCCATSLRQRRPRGSTLRSTGTRQPRGGGRAVSATLVAVWGEGVDELGVDGCVEVVDASTTGDPVARMGGDYGPVQPFQTYCEQSENCRGKFPSSVVPLRDDVATVFTGPRMREYHWPSVAQFC